MWYALLHPQVWQPDVDGRSLFESLFTSFTEVESLNCAQSSQIWIVWLQELPVSVFWTLEFEADEPTWHLCGFWGEIQLWCLCLWTIPQSWRSLCEMVSYCAHSRDTAGPQEKVGTSGETGRQSEASHVLPLHMQVTSLCRPASSALQPTRHNTASQVCNLKS